MFKKILVSIIMVLTSVTLFACGTASKFITTSGGEKQYKKEDGELARNEWIEINKNKYYFDMNGYLQKNKWIENEYYVDEEGKMKTKQFYKNEENDKTYYLGSDGKYIRNTLITIEKNDYYFDKDGCMIIDEVFESDSVDDNGNKKKMYADANGYINHSNGIVMVKDDGYFIDSEGFIFNDGWKEIEKDWYYFMPSGKMKKNEWFEATYYFKEDGKMLKNDKSPEGYEVDKEGKVLEEYKKYLLANDFQYLYQQYCKYPWAEVAGDGSYLSIDSNPEDYDNTDHPALSTMYVKDASNAIKEINKAVGFSEYVYKKMGETTYNDGKQYEENGDIKVEWKYHPDKGMEVMYTKVNKNK